MAIAAIRSAVSEAVQIPEDALSTWLRHSRQIGPVFVGLNANVVTHSLLPQLTLELPTVLWLLTIDRIGRACSVRPGVRSPT